MKYLVLIGDGMADRPLQELNGKTPLMVARTPHMDTLASQGVTGSVRTVPKGMNPGSDVANLSILGYDPSLYYTGRAPLEAASMGIELAQDDIAFRCNLVNLDLESPDGPAMVDYSAGHITSAEAALLIQALQEGLAQDDRKGERIAFYPGVSYRHLMVWHGGPAGTHCTPPHDITDRKISAYLPQGEGGAFVRQLMEQSRNILASHEVNKKRVAQGKRPANSIWLWGQGGKPSMPRFADRYHLTGALISAVDLTKGLGVYAGLSIIDVPGATGYLDTNYEGKASFAVEALKDRDFVYIHVEAPDEAGHTGNLKDKIQAIEDFDRRVLGKTLELLEGVPFRMLIMPDHATPISVKTHTDEPVPFILYDSTQGRDGSCKAGCSYDESILDRKDSLHVEEGHCILDYLIKGSNSRSK